jgi:chemotaxis response regulator CheB
MNIIEQTLSQRERELENYLARLDDPTLRQLLTEITVLKQASQIVARVPQSQGAPLQAVVSQASQNGHHARPVAMSQGDATEDILIKAGHEVGIDEVMTELAQRGIKAKKESFIATLRKDRRKRFRVIGGKAYLRSASDKQTTSNGNGSRESLASMGFSLMGSIKELLPQLPLEFSQPIVYKTLLEKYPHMAKHIQKASVATTLRKLSDDGVIKVTHQGFGSDPRRYKNAV